MVWGLGKTLDQIKLALVGRVVEAYIFGSASDGSFNEDSDIDLILVKSEASDPFVERPLEFKDLYDIWPAMDILVYSPQELKDQPADSDVGFWYSVKSTLKQII